MGVFIKAAKTNELSDNNAMLVEAEGKSIALFHSGGAYYALDNECTHVGGPLCEGMISGDEVICPWHGAQFDLKTGQVKGGPARADVHAYPVRVQGEDVEIEV
jgi:3-phenylpropionate/trans-cinnamate dioxygenase ferredoxin component